MYSYARRLQQRLIIGFAPPALLEPLKPVAVGGDVLEKRFSELDRMLRILPRDSRFDPVGNLIPEGWQLLSLRKEARLDHPSLLSQS